MDKEYGNYQKPRKVRIVVEKCPVGREGRPCHCHEEGQVFTFDFERCPSDFCAAAFHNLWPQLRVMELGGRHPWDETAGVTRVACPDPDKPTIFRIETFAPDKEE